MGRSTLAASGGGGRPTFSSHPWFFGPLPVKRILTGSPGGPDARPRAPHADPPHARQPAAAVDPGRPAAGRQPGVGAEALRPAVLPLPPRRPAAPSPPPDPQRRRQDAHRVRPPGPPRGGAGMGRRVSTPQGSAGRGQSVDPGPGQTPRPATPPPEGPTLSIGPILARTVRHYFPDLHSWLAAVDDPRSPPQVIYDKRFLLWWGLALFLCKLGSRRQLDYQLNSDGPQVLTNVNRLAGTQQTTRPVNQTLEYFLDGIGDAPVAALRLKMVHRLIRMKALDEARLQGRFLVLIDGTGYLVFHHRHCQHCLTQQHGDTTVYLHQVLEA